MQQRHRRHRIAVLAAFGPAFTIVAVAAAQPKNAQADAMTMPTTPAAEASASANAMAYTTDARDGMSAGAAAAAPAPDPRDANTEAAVRALSRYVARSSHDDALRTAFRAYYNYRAANESAVKKPYLFFVDLGLDNRTRRGYVFDMDRLALIDGPFTVSHGSGSGARNGVPGKFSNRPGSKASSLGLYLAQETYTFRGKSGGRAYSSVGLRMRGESGRFNNAARRRGIVSHGAPYVSASDAGRSQGCPAMEPARARKLLPMIANGGVVFIYSPNDGTWLRDDPWASQ